jgi:acyl carrier protein
MAVEGMEANVRQILETALETSLAEIEDPAREEFERWDSLAHLEIVFMLEEKFDVRFSEEEIGALDSLSRIVAIVSASNGRSG